MFARHAFALISQLALLSDHNVDLPGIEPGPWQLARLNFVDSPGIEPGPRVSECHVIPFYYRPCLFIIFELRNAPFLSFPRKREPRIHRIVLDPRFREDDRKKVW